MNIRERAQTVVVGAGIVGASAAFYLAQLGVTDVLVLDHGPPFGTGGSTAHAPGLVFQTSGSRTMSRIAQDTVALYRTLDLNGVPSWYGVGSIEVAATPERMRELMRRRGFGRSFGIEGGELLTSAEVVERIPLVNADHILGGYRVPSDGVVDAMGATAALTRRAQELGVAFEGGVTLTGFDVAAGRVRGVQTDRGPIGCERVLLCVGIWGPTVGALAGVPVPLVAIDHRFVWSGPVPELAGETREVAHPILRHQDAAMYFRHRRDRYGVGTHGHEPIVTSPGPIGRPSGTDQVPALTPDSRLVEAERLLPALAGRLRPAEPERSVGWKVSFTPDNGPIVGESAAVRGMWLCEGVRIAHAGGMGRQIAEWMALGEPSYDMAEADANRFYPFQTTPPYVLERGTQQYREVDGIVHPRRQIERPRKLRLTPFYVRHVDLGARFVVEAGWERPQWFEANRPLLTGAAWEERDPWAATLWSPVEGAEHRAARSAVALFDITPLAKFDVHGPDAERFLEAICANRIAARPVGSVVPTLTLNAAGGVRCDLTLARKADDLFRVVTEGAAGQQVLAWLRMQIRADVQVAVTERTGGLFALGLWGPRARDVLAVVTDADVSNDAFPYRSARYINVGEVGPVWAQRISCVGELGWELYGQIAMGDRVWELLWDAGRAHGLVAAGLGALNALRLETGLPSGENPGGDGASGKRLTRLTLEDPTAVVLAGEPISVDGRVVGYVTSAGYGYSIGRGIAYGHLPLELAAEGTHVEIEYFDARYAATVSVKPLVDPGGDRVRS